MGPWASLTGLLSAAPASPAFVKRARPGCRALEDRLRLHGRERGRCHGGQADSGVGDSAGVVEPGLHRRAHRGEVAGSPRELRVCAAAARAGDPDPDFRQHFRWLDRGLVGVQEEFAPARLAPRPRCGADERSLERNQDPAGQSEDGSAWAQEPPIVFSCVDLRVANAARRVVDDRQRGSARRPRRSAGASPGRRFETRRRSS